MKPVLNHFKQAYSGLPEVAWVLAVVNLINRAGSMVLPFLTLYVHGDLGFSLGFAGLAVSCYGLGALAGSFWGGWISDRVAPRRVLMAHLIGSGLSLLLLEHLRQRWLLIGGLILQGTITEAVRPISAVVLINRCELALRPRAFSLQRMAINLGASLGPALGGFLAVYSYRWLFRIDGVTCLLATLPLLLLPHIGGRRAADPQHIPSTGSAWRDPPFLVFMLVVLVTGALFMQLFSTYPLFLKEGMGLDERQFGLLESFNGLMIVTFEMALTHHLGAKRPLRVVSVGLVFLACGLGMLPWGQGFLYAIASAVLWTVGEMLIAPFLSTFVSKAAPADRIGSYMGMFNMGWAAAFIYAPLMGGFVSNHFGFYALWSGVAVLGVLGSVLCLRLDRFLQSRENSGS